MKIKIYQIDQDRDKLRVKFCGLQETQKIQHSKGQSVLLNPSIYNEVFSGEVDCKTLEDIYQLFNLDHPPTHRGHSLSVSDIVEITENSNNYLQGCFFCDSLGFESIDFDVSKTFKPDNLLRVVMVEPGKPAYEAEIEDTLKSLQRAVRGRMEVTFPLGTDLPVISNAQSKSENLPNNREIHGGIYAGNFLIIGDGGNDTFCSLTDDQVQQYLERFKEPEFSNENMDEESGIQMS